MQTEFQNDPVTFTPWCYTHDYVIGCRKRGVADVIKLTNQMTL